MIPTREQRAVLDAGSTSMRISAGAGTGKTTTVALLVADLVGRRGLEPEQILGLTFTNKAAAELADRIRAMIAPISGPGREAEVHTYHGFAAQVIGEFGALVGIERGSSVITPTFSRQLLFEVLRTRRFDHFNSTWPGSVDRIQRLGAALGDHLADPDQVAAAAGEDDPWPERLEILAAWGDYQAEKRRLGVVDYADLVASAARLLELHPDIADRLRSRYAVILLDEYQDTNPAQRVLLQKVFTDGFPVVAVGDTDQTIYEWRGATPDNFEQFPRHFPTAQGSPALALALTVNRRSDRRIIHTANAIRSQIGSSLPTLQPAPGAGEGSVGVRWAADAVAEADWIADQAVRLHERGTEWREMAVLFRKNRNIAQVHDALVERDIPVEVANLGGLLSVPEVADLIAWMRLIQTPEDGPALLRILMGPRLRLGLGDLAHLTRWVAAQSQGTDDVDIDHDRLPRHTMLEAIDHLDDILDLPRRVKNGLHRFAGEYRLLLEVAQGVTLAELARTILDLTGTWRDVEAMGPSGRLTARLNLYRFLDLTEEWSPLEGRPSLAAFLAHLAAMDENPAEELDAARLSGEDAVALLTVHRAKGLEWDVVFVPAVAKRNFPTTSSGFENPHLSAQFLPHEWRLDDPPAIDAEMSKTEADDLLRHRHLRQEWRIAYVAATRARHHLFVSGAHWYGAPITTQQPVEPSELFELVAGLDTSDDLGRDPAPERPEILRAPDRTPAPDPLFADGWAAAVRAALTDDSFVDDLAVDLGLTAPVAAATSEFQQRLFDVTSLPSVETDAGTPRTSVTGLVTYAACPKRHYWTEVDRLPRRPSPAARRGVEVHRRIELHNLGRVPLTSGDADTYDMIDPDASVGTSAYQAYLDSRYATRKPLMVEVPFEIETTAGLSVRGRIDAVYPDAGGWEIVDFKSGRRRSEPWLEVQLQAYAMAARTVDFGLERPDSIGVSFVYLGDGLDVARTEADEEWMRAAEDKIEGLAAGIVARSFDPVPSPACRSCEFVRFCPAGAAWLEADRP